MKNTVLFRCLAADQIEWHDGEWHLGSVVEFAAATRNKRRTLVVPTERILLTATSVPGRNRALRIKALPYTLEDSLADPVEDLHFAIGALTATDVAVAVVRHAVMEAWLATLDALGMTIDAMIPDALLLPLADNAWSVLLEERRAVVRLTPWRGFACERALLPLFLQRALEHHQAPVLVWLWAAGSAPELSDPGLDIRRAQGPGAAFAVFAQSPASAAINLLQRRYARARGLRHTLVPWRAAAALGGAWLALQASHGLIEYRRLAGEQTALQSEIEQVLRAAVPTTRKIVNARAQLDSRLQELRHAPAGSANAFLTLLERGGAALAEQRDPGLRIRALRYQDDRLDFDLEGGSPEAIDQLRQKLQTLPGTSVELRSSKRDGKVESQLSLRMAPS